MCTTAAEFQSFTNKRLRNSDDEDDSQDRKMIKTNSFYVTLESDSPIPSDEDSEPIDSSQDRETVYVRDTSDTCSFLSGSDDGIAQIEYSIATMSEREHPFGFSETSSGPDDIIVKTLPVICDIGLANDSETSHTSVDSEIGKANYWECVKCNNKNNNPMFRYCEKCYQIRKNHLPPRPTKKRRRNRTKPKGLKSSIGETSGTASTSLVRHDSGLGLSGSQGSETPSFSQGSQKTEDEETEKQSQDSHCSQDSESSASCLICSENPKNGGFLHGTTLHVCYCYQCAYKTLKNNGQCPICNRRAKNVIKVFYA